MVVFTAVSATFYSIDCYVSVTDSIDCCVSVTDNILLVGTKQGHLLQYKITRNPPSGKMDVTLTEVVSFCVSLFLCLL